LSFSSLSLSLSVVKQILPERKRLSCPKERREERKIKE
jgi:hypothetical protein